jgi:S1-C subfamily serine protease
MRVGDLPTATAEKVDILGGLQLVTVTPAVRQERGVRSERGALIYAIPDATASRTGLRTGDVIRSINQAEVTEAADVERLLQTARGRGAVQIVYERAGSLGAAYFYVR